MRGTWRSVFCKEIEADPIREEATSEPICKVCNRRRRNVRFNRFY